MYEFIGEHRTKFPVYGIQLRSTRQQYMVFDLSKWLRCLGLPPRPGVMEVERGAMIDQPEFFIPPEHIGIAGCAVYIEQERVQPDDLRGEFLVQRSDGRVESERTREIVQREIQSLAGFEQV